MKPSVGRIVHFISYTDPADGYDSNCQAAIVTAVKGKRARLRVFKPDGEFNTDWRPEGNKEDEVPGTWHWPERVDEKS